MLYLESLQFPLLRYRPSELRVVIDYLLSSDETEQEIRHYLEVQTRQYTTCRITCQQEPLHLLSQLSEPR